MLHCMSSICWPVDCFSHVASSLYSLPRYSCSTTDVRQSKNMMNGGKGPCFFGIATSSARFRNLNMLGPLSPVGARLPMGIFLPRTCYARDLRGSRVSTNRNAVDGFVQSRADRKLCIRKLLHRAFRYDLRCELCV